MSQEDGETPPYAKMDPIFRGVMETTDCHYAGLQHHGQSHGQVTAIPEPLTALLLFGAATALALIRRRR